MPTLKERVENNVITVIVGACASVAVAVASAGGWVVSNMNEANEAKLSAAQSRFEADMAATLRERDDAFDTERKALQSQLDALREEAAAAEASRLAALDAAKAETSAALSRLREEHRDAADALSREVSRLGRLIKLHGSLETGATISLGEIYGRVDEDEVLMNPRVAPYYDGQLYALGDQADDVERLRLPLGASGQMLTREDFAFSEAAELPDDAATETVWLMDEVKELTGARIYRRVAPFCAVHRVDVGLAQGATNRFAAGKPTLSVFLDAFNQKITMATSVNLNLRVQRVVQSDAVYFAHFRTRLGRIPTEGGDTQLMFLHDLLFTAPAGGDGVFVAKCAFASDKRTMNEADHWGSVAEWWSTLRVNAG